MTSSAGRRNAVVIAVVVVAVVIAVLLVRAAMSSPGPEAERVAKVLLSQGYLAPDIAALPTEPGSSVRMDLRTNGATGSGVLVSCTVTIGQTPDDVQVTNCTRITP